MRDIKVSKTQLLSILNKNRGNHFNTFLKAQEGFRKEIIQKLEERLAEARKGNRISLYIELDEPVNETKSYDRIIAMLEMSEDDTILLSETDFQQYVQDNWTWTLHATASNSKYIDK